MKTQLGKVIAIVGPSRVGKTLLANLLAKRLKGFTFLEGDPESFPKRIQEDIFKNIRPLERGLWFRNKYLQMALQAQKAKEDGRIIFLDAHWLLCEPYADFLYSGFERKLFLELARIDRELLPWPDVVLHLKISEKSMRRFVELGKRSHEQSETFFREQILPINRLVEKFFNQSKIKTRVISIQRDGLDFTKKKDLQKIVDIINSQIP